MGNKKKHVGKKLKCFPCMNISGEKRLMECVSKVGVQYTVKPTFYKYSRSPTNSHFPETATFLADSLYIDSCLNLSTSATFFCPRVSVVESFNCNSFRGLKQSQRQPKRQIITTATLHVHYICLYTAISRRL